MKIDNILRVRFLRTMAEYFDSQTIMQGDEDKSFWAFSQNAENCRKIAEYLESLG